MAIAFRAQNTGVAALATTVTITKPTGTVDGDVMIAVIVCTGGSGATITAPTGWTQRTLGNNLTNIKTQTCFKVASGEGADYTWTFDTDRNACGAIVTYSGVDIVDPMDNSNLNTQQHDTVGSTNVVAPTTTPNTTPTMLLFLGTSNTASTFTAPTDHGGMTERSDVRVGASTLPSATIAEVAYTGLAATGTSTGVSSASGANTAIHILLRSESGNAAWLNPQSLLGVPKHYHKKPRIAQWHVQPDIDFSLVEPPAQPTPWYAEWQPNWPTAYKTQHYFESFADPTPRAILTEEAFDQVIMAAVEPQQGIAIPHLKQYSMTYGDQYPISLTEPPTVDVDFFEQSGGKAWPRIFPRPAPADPLPHLTSVPFFELVLHSAWYQPKQRKAREAVEAVPIRVDTEPFQQLELVWDATWVRARRRRSGPRGSVLENTIDPLRPEDQLPAMSLDEWSQPYHPIRGAQGWWAERGKDSNEVQTEDMFFTWATAWQTPRELKPPKPTRESNPLIVQDLLTESAFFEISGGAAHYPPPHIPQSQSLAWHPVIQETETSLDWFVSSPEARSGRRPLRRPDPGGEPGVAVLYDTTQNPEFIISWAVPSVQPRHKAKRVRPGQTDQDLITRGESEEIGWYAPFEQPKRPKDFAERGIRSAWFSPWSETAPPIYESGVSIVISGPYVIICGQVDVAGGAVVGMVTPG